jgi:hypothetical protein
MRQRLLISAGFVAIIVGVILIGQLVFVLQRVAPTAYSMPPTLPAASDLMNGVDKSVGMMFSLTLGLFVLAGFVLRGMEHPRRVSRFSIATSACFLAASVFSLYMGFMARNVALYYASFPSELSIRTSGTFIVLQAIGVAVAALCAILLFSDFFLSPATTSESKGKKS